MINTSNLFLMNNVFFIFRTSKHNTECFFIRFRARKKDYDHFSRGQCLFVCAIIKYINSGKTSLKVVLSTSTCCSRAGFGRKHKPIVLRPFTVGMHAAIKEL